MGRFLFSLLASIAASMPAFAGDSNTDAELAEIVVTATLRSAAAIDSAIVQTNPDLQDLSGNSRVLYAGEFNLTPGNHNSVQVSILGILLKVLFLASQLEKIIDPAVAIGAIFLVFFIPSESGGLGWGRLCCRWASRHLSIPSPASLALVPVVVVNLDTNLISVQRMV